MDLDPDNLDSSFHRACEKGHIDIVKQLLKDENVDVNKISEDDDTTPFYVACEEGHIEIVKLLLSDSRIDPNIPNENGKTSFYCACERGDVELVKLLLNDNRIDINQANDFHVSPILIACQQGHIEIVNYFLASRREVDLNPKNNNYGKTVIGIARELEKEEKKRWESEEEFQKRKKNYRDMIEILESYQRNPNETRTKLRIQLGLAGKYFSFNFFFSIFFFQEIK